MVRKKKRRTKPEFSARTADPDLKARLRRVSEIIGRPMSSIICDGILRELEFIETTHTKFKNLVSEPPSGEVQV